MAETTENPAALRAYGYHFAVTREDPERCAVETSPSRRGDHPSQCSRKRTVGLLCAQHAKEARPSVPSVGGWGRHVLERLERDRKPLADAVEKLAEIDRNIARVTEGLALLAREGGEGEGNDG